MKTIIDYFQTQHFVSFTIGATFGRRIKPTEGEFFSGLSK
jgi:hypothetical protein